jgi:hypothetical protein
MKSTSQRSQRFQRSATFFFGVALLALAVFLGSLDWLQASEANFLMDGTGDLFCSPSAVHPGQALHIERSTVVKRMWSPVRIHQMRAKNARLAGAVALTPPLLRTLLVEAPDLTAIGAFLRPTGARAPPLS